MARKQTEEPHYHGHVDAARLADSEAQRSNFQAALNGPDEVVEWLSSELRKAASNPDMSLVDEGQLWHQFATEREPITTGLQTGPTLMAVPIPEDRCPCERPELRTVRGRS
ncbi:hypothetical protein EV191_11814 [Tamaricihabitans halophyticus]|uniref:Uncharacterized protein n=1 Tax=Tamaricihabitans halophyticus TaxID=1262583 RepID=A0A4R2Q869_9PSEU|nr:hypothetical protein [Tamaricihabitans halophyticus]TCP45032.1 hypothetical protein EV191_11814 [Tamaricihabitans halophyticus]